MISLYSFAESILIALAKYERALEKENRRIAGAVRKYFGDDPDMERLDEVLSKAKNNFGTYLSSGKGSPAGFLLDIAI